MIRDIDRLVARQFDLLVVGGGIYGLAIAYDAAQRGLEVALVERDDFGSGASFNHLRTIHGGLRYLQTLNIARARESIRERRTLARIAPHAVRPQLFALPLYRSFLKGKTAMRLGLALDRVVAADRNLDVPPPLRLPAGRVVSRGDAVQQFPGLGGHDLTGAAVWYDYVTLESDRLTFAFALAASQHGAVLANYLEATALIMERRRVGGVRALDRRSGREVEIAAHVTVNATGSAIDRLLGPIGAPTRIPMLKAMNLVTRRDGSGYALGGRSQSGRHLFMVPWRHRALFGTWASGHACEAGDSGVTEAEVASLIADLNYAFPSLDLTFAEVALVHHGVVPAVVGSDGRAALEGDQHVHDHAASGVDGLLSVAGTKYTTARAVAEGITDRILAKLERGSVPCRTAITPLPGGGLDVAQTVAEARRERGHQLPSDTISHLVAAYGSLYRDVLDTAIDRPDWRSPITDDSPVIGAQLAWAVREEMALTLSDAVVRRTPLGALGFPGQAAAARAADFVGAELGWSQDRKQEEIETLRRYYAPVEDV